MKQGLHGHRVLVLRRKHERGLLGRSVSEIDAHTACKSHGHCAGIAGRGGQEQRALTPGPTRVRRMLLDPCPRNRVATKKNDLDGTIRGLNSLSTILSVHNVEKASRTTLTTLVERLLCPKH